MDGVALGMLTPWREGGTFGPGFQFTAEGYVRGTAEDDPRGQFRIVSPGFFAALGVPMIAGRDFNDLDRKGSEPVMIVSQSVAQRMFPNREALNRHVTLTDPIIKFIGMKPTPMRIVGIAADIDDEHLVPQPTLTLYTPFGQGPLFGGRLFVHVRSDPYALINPITRTIRDLSADQPVERAATLEDVRAEVLTPDRLNAMVFGGFAVVALTDCGGGRGGRPGIFGERADARIRHPAGDRVATAASADAGDRGGHGDYGSGDRRRIGVRVRAAAGGGQLLRERADAGGVGSGWRGGRIAGSGRGRVRVAGDAGCARGCDSGPAGGLVWSRNQSPTGSRT